MKSLLPVATLALVGLFVPAASAQDKNYDSLLRQVETLEKEVNQLQKEVRDLTRQLAMKQGPAPAPAMPDLRKLLEQFGGGEGLDGMMERLQDELGGLDLDALLKQFGQGQGGDLSKLLEQLQGRTPEDPPDLNKMLDQLQEQFGDQFDLRGMLDQFRENMDGEQMQRMMDELEKLFEHFDAPPSQDGDDETI